MCEWAVYVALHVPDVSFWPGLRNHLVQELLTAHCPEWRADMSKLEFLKGQLRIPKVTRSKKYTGLPSQSARICF
jgi:hypothetical protein